MIGNTLGIIKNNYDVWIKQKKHILCKSQQSKIVKNPASTFTGLLPLLWYTELSYQKVLDLKETWAFSCLRHSALMERSVFRKKSNSPWLLYCTYWQIFTGWDWYQKKIKSIRLVWSCDETAPVRQHWKSSIKREDGEKSSCFLIIV